MRKYFLAALAFLAIAVASASAASAAAAVRSTTVTFADLGYSDDNVVPGIYPSFTFTVPVSRTLVGAQLNLHVRVSPLADPKSSVKVLVNNVPVFARFISQTGTDAHLVVPLPVPGRGQRYMQVMVEGYLFVTGDICYDLQTADLWMTVAHDSSLTMFTAIRPGTEDISDFFQGYGNRIVVVDPRAASLDAGDLDVLSLPYDIRQIESWHQPTISMASHPESGARNIVVRPGDDRYDSVTDTLYLDPHDLDLADFRFAKLLVTPTVKGGSVSVNPGTPASDNRLTLSQMGIASQTANGLGEIAFEYPLQANRFGGIPSGLVYHIAYAYTPLAPNSFAMIRVELNGSLVASRTLASNGGSDVWDVALPDSGISTANDVRVIVAYSTGPGSCRGSLPKLFVTIDNTSYFSWSKVNRSTNGVADFLKSAGGNVGVLVGDGSLMPQAFHIVDELGHLNSNVGHIAVSKFDGTIPSNLDYAIVVAPPNQLQKLNEPLDLTSSRFGILNPLTGQTVFASRFGKPLGALETSNVGGTPVLALSYWQSPAGLSRFDSYGINELSQQLGNVAIFSDQMQTYQVGDKLRVFYATGDALSEFWSRARLPLALVLLLGIVGFVIYASRRLTGTIRS